MQPYRYISLKGVPAARLLAAFIAGIILQWYASLSFIFIAVAGIIISVVAASFFLLPEFKKYNWRWLQGMLMLLLFTVCGAMLIYTKNIQHQPNWYQNSYSRGSLIIATINEPLTIKPNSYKAIAKITAVQNNHSAQQAMGSVLIYFKKDSSLMARIKYGSRIAFCKPLQAIQNTGNPGGFDYKRYLLFQGITAQVYLQVQEFVVLPQEEVSSFPVFLQRVRAHIITVLQTYIPGKQEQGVAEALLIGYRNDLDKQLVQSYSHTGVVHIIAISGLHLGMIYAALLFLFSPFKNRRWYRFVMPVIVLVILWLFTFIAGAVPSIVRSAVMFSFIVLGECLRRKTNIYNTLAVSAICLLIYNPFYLWDVGFQLSYAAVLSIIVFMKPICNQLYFENKIINKIWLLISANIAAQIFTLPIVLFYFHQFPLLFLVSNLLVVPLSTIILFIEILVVAVAKWTWLATLSGKLANGLLWLMNSFIVHIEKLPFTVWQNIKTDVFQTIVLYIIILLVMAWLFIKKAKVLLYALVVMLIFTVYTAVDIVNTKQQQKLVVYNVPKSAAIDIIQGGNCNTLVTQAVLKDHFLQAFYLSPTRLLYRTVPNRYSMLTASNYLLHVANKNVLIIGKQISTSIPRQKLAVDAVIITGNPTLYMSQIATLVNTPVIVFGSDNPAWKIDRWKKDCNSLHLPFHSVAQKGAFVMDL